MQCDLALTRNTINNIIKETNYKKTTNKYTHVRYTDLAVVSS